MNRYRFPQTWSYLAYDFIRINIFNTYYKSSRFRYTQFTLQNRKP